jgi:hypothetical protein
MWVIVKYQSMHQARTTMDEHEFRWAVLLIVWRLFDANL